MAKKLLSTILAAAMAASVIPGVLAEDAYTDVNEIHVDLTDYVNADYIGLIGDSTSSGNFGVNNRAEKWGHMLMLDGSNISKTEDGVVSVKRRYSQIDESGSNGWVETEDITTFKMQKDGVEAGKADSIAITDKGSLSYTVNLSGRPIDEIDFLTFCYGNHFGGTINYKDGTKKAFSKLRGVGNDIDMYASTIPYAGTNSESLAFITKTGNADFVIAHESGAIGGYPFPGQYLIPADDNTLKGHITIYNEEVEKNGSSEIASTGKTIGAIAIAVSADPQKQAESITFTSDSEAMLRTAVLAVTEAALSNSEMLEYIEGIDIANPAEHSKELTVAKNYIEELVTYRGYSESQFADVLKAAEDAAWYAEGYDVQNNRLDIFNNSYELADFLGKVGDKPVKEEWAANGAVTFNKYNIDTPYHAIGDPAPAGYRIDNFADAKTTGVLKIPEVAAFGTGGGSTSSGTGYEIEFYLPVEGQEGGVPDSVVVSDTQNSGGVTIPASGKNVDELYFFAPTWQGSVSVILNYADGSSEELTSPGFNQNFASGWSNANFNNRAYKVWNEDKSEYSVNANKIGIAGQFSSFSYQYLVIGADGTLVNHRDACETTGNQTLGIFAFGADVNERKKLESITFPASNKMAVLAVTERVKTNAEMLEFIEGIDLGADPASIAQDLELALSYIDELEIRHIAKREEFADIIEAYENSKWYAEGVEGGEQYVDITSYFNADTIAEVDQTYDPQIIMGLNDNEIMKAGTAIKNSGGILTFKERYALTASEGWKENGNSFKMNIPLAGTDAGVKDAIVINKNVTPEGVTIDIENEAVEYIRIAMDSKDTMSPVAIVNYTDGTSDEVSLKTRRMASVVYDGNRAERAYLVASEDESVISESLNGGVISWYDLATVKPDSETGKIIAGSSGTNGIFVNQIKADKSKITDSITIKLDNEKSIGIVAMNIVTVSNDELKAVIEEADKIAAETGYIQNEEEAGLIKAAAEYAVILDKRHIRKIDDEANKNVIGLSNQVKYFEGCHMDLTQYLNADIIVAEGDEIPAVYESERNLFYKGSLVPADGVITMVKQNDVNIDVDDPETGRVFKLNGEYTKAGNDSVKVAKDGVGFTLPMEETANYTDMAFIIDALWASNGAGQGYSTVNASVNYSDGTSEDVELKAWCADGFYVPQFFAHSHVNFQRMKANPESGIYENDPIVSGKNSAYMFSSSLKPNENKKVESVTFKPSESGDYYILAGTAEYVSTENLVNKMFEYYDLGLTSAAQVTSLNAKTVLEGSDALIELYEKRGFNVIEGWFTAEDYELAKVMYNAALAAESIEDNVLKFVPSIEVANGKMTATFVMTNTKDYEQKYVLIAAVYGENNKLLAINCSEEGTLTFPTVDVKTISVDIPEGAVEYKAFVWDGMNTMIPLSEADK